MSKTCVWAYKPLDELGGKTGIVECDSEISTRLIKCGDAQDLRSGHQLKRIERAMAPADYTKKVMDSPKKKGRKGKDDAENGNDLLTNGDEAEHEMA